MQWEIARFVSLGKLKVEDIPIPRLDELKGTNSSAASRVPTVLFIQEKTSDAASATGIAAMVRVAICMDQYFCLPLK